MDKEDHSDKDNGKEFLLFGKIPLIALIFPPIGFAMLLNYLLTKQNKEWSNMETWVYLIIGISSAAWITHVFTCLSDDRWGFLIAGAIMAPIAIVHGIGIWFGFF